MTPQAGQSIGRYHLVEQLGRGGMATVFKAFDTRLQRDVAIKFIRSELFGAGTAADEMLKRFEREAMALAQLDHPAIVKIFDYGEFEQSPYLVMQYIPGGTLKQKTGSPLPYAEAAALVAPIARALEYAHEENIIHRDVKPANILLTRRYYPMLSDFGIAKILEAQDGNTLTGANVGIGTPEYMAPEQWLNQVVPASDQYALGIVFYELVTGKRPYTADTPAAVLLKQATEPLPRPGTFVPNLPEKVEHIIFKTLAKEPGERFANMGLFAQALEALASAAAMPEVLAVTATLPASPVEPKNQPTPRQPIATPPPAPTRSTPWYRSKWMWLGVPLVLIAAFLILLGGVRFARLASQQAGASATPPPTVSPLPAVIETSPPTAPPAETAAAAVQPGEVDCASPAIFCVGLVADSQNIKDGGFNESAWEAVNIASKEPGVHVEVAPSENPDYYLKNIYILAEKKYDLIVTAGFNIAAATHDAAKQFPNTRFIGIDQPPSESLPNLINLTFAEDKAGFLAGALAAQMDQSNRIGAVLGPDSVPAVWRYGEGYRAGALYVRPDIDVITIYHNEADVKEPFNDPAWGAGTAKMLVDKGADVIFAAGGVTGNGAIELCAKLNVMAIGVDTDQYYTLSGVQSVLLSSAVKETTSSTAELIKRAKAGDFPAGSYVGGGGLAPFHEFETRIPQAVKDRLATIDQALRNGSLKTNVSPSKP
jgi:basic membrane protein A and related proteins